MTSQNPNYNVPEGYKLQKEKKPFYKRLGCIIPLAIVALLIIAVAAGLGGENSSSDSTSDSAEGNTLTYQVETDGSTSNVTYVQQGSNISQEQGVQSGWSKDVQFDSKFDAIGANMTAQLDGSGTVTCRILWNGEVVSETTSTGDYVVASCSPDQEKM